MTPQRSDGCGEGGGTIREGGCLSLKFYCINNLPIVTRTQGRRNTGQSQRSAGHCIRTGKGRRLLVGNNSSTQFKES